MNDFFKKVDGFFVDSKMEVLIVIDGKEVIYPVRYVLRVSKKEGSFLFFNNYNEKSIPITFDNIKDFFDGNYYFIYEHCKNYVWEKITKDAIVCNKER